MIYHDVVLQCGPPVCLDNTAISSYTPYERKPDTRGGHPILKTAAPIDALRTSQIELALPPQQIRRRPGILDAGKVRGCRFHAPCPPRLDFAALLAVFRCQVVDQGTTARRPGRFSAPPPLVPVSAGSQGQRTELGVCLRALLMAYFLGTAHLAAQPGSTSCAHLEGMPRR